MLVTPLELGFEDVGWDRGGWFVVGWLIDVFFMVDIGVNLRTGCARARPATRGLRRESARARGAAAALPVPGMRR